MRGLLLLAWGLCLAGCAATRDPRTAESGPQRVWPPAPAEPRLAYVQSIYGPKDLGVRWSKAKRFTFWLLGVGGEQERLVRPFGLALDELDNLCLVDSGTASVCYFDRAQKTWQTWDRIGRIQLVSPVAVAKCSNTLFVADSVLQKVLVFDTRGKVPFELNHPLIRPAGLAVHQGKLFVADAGAHQVLIFGLDGKFLSAFGSRGTGPGEFNFPTHLASGAHGQLWVTDAMNFRIQAFDAEGLYQATIGSAGDSSGHLSRPKGIAVDAGGNLYVIDALFDNLQIFDPQGNFLLHAGEGGSGPGEFWLPSGIAIGRDAHIYVADSYNHRIQVLKSLSQP